MVVPSDLPEVIPLAVGATLLGLVPLAWMEGLRERGIARPAAWWWVAAALAVSFVADVAGAAGLTPYASQVYPVLQAALIALVLVERPAFVGYVALLLFTAALSIVWRGAGGYDVLLRFAAHGGVALIAWAVLPESLIRWVLALGFAGMLAAWLYFTVEPGWAGWGTLQTARLATTVGFCISAVREA